MRARVPVSLVGSLCLAVGAGFILIQGALLSAAGAQTQLTGSEAVSAYRTVLNRYCATCHNERLQTGGFALDTMDLSNVGRDGEAWEKVARKLRLREMPPAGRRRPDEDTYDGFASWLERSLDAPAISRPQSRSAGAAPPQSGRTRQRSFATCSRSRSTPRRCRRMIRPTALTTLRTCSASRPSCWRAM